jgi:hypothetical protein
MEKEGYTPEMVWALPAELTKKQSEAAEKQAEAAFRSTTIYRQNFTIHFQPAHYNGFCPKSGRDGFNAPRRIFVSGRLLDPA